MTRVTGLAPIGPSFGGVTTWTLKTNPTDGPARVTRGLTREQALWALTDLMYGTYDDEAARAADEQAGERLAA